LGALSKQHPADISARGELALLALEIGNEQAAEKAFSE
jgi:hypothetical protein